VATSNQRQVGIRQQDITTTQAQQRQAEAQLSQTEARLADTDVHAPLNGVVSLRLARQGEVVNAGDPIVTIIDLDDVWISAAVPESQMGRVALDDVLSVELASGERLEGRVSVISPEAAFATQRDVSRDTRDIRTFAIRVAVPNGERRLHAGMTAYVTLSRAPVRSDPPSR
jgi:HlyD family secretion protein